MTHQLKIWAGALAVSTCGWLPLAVHAAPVLSITPAVQTAAVGDTVSVAVGISGLLGENPRQLVSAFDLDVLFSSVLLAQNGVGVFQASALMGGADAFFDTLGTGPGVATGNAYSLLSDADLIGLQGDSFNLFTISFTALSDGAAFLDFGASPLFQRLVVGSNGQAMPLTYAGACVAIGTAADCNRAVPEPGSYGLAALALMAAGFATRRRPGALGGSA